MYLNMLQTELKTNKYWSTKEPLCQIVELSEDLGTIQKVHFPPPPPKMGMPVLGMEGWVKCLPIVIM